MTSRERKAARATSRAIIDIGSNTVRLVIYGPPLRAPEVLHNEKVTARLGKGVAENGLLGNRAMATSLAALARYRTLLQLRGIENITVVATAASRDSRNGPEFLDQVRALGFEPRLLTGEEEAVTSAHGVIGAFPGARGIAADLGGGSLELTDIDGDRCRHGVSLPLGSLRLPAMRTGGDRAFGQIIGKALKKADWSAEPGTTLYLVGGSLRAFARYAMHMMDWPIDDPHGFELAADDATRIARRLAGKRTEALPALEGLASGRLAALPDTAALLAVLVRRLQPAKLVFSAWGLREGLLIEELPEYVRGQDPLVAGVSAFAAEQGISPHMGAMVAGWTLAASSGSGRRENLRLAATLLCLATATVEPNLRRDLARDWGLRKRWVGISPVERVLLAAAMIAVTGKTDLPSELAAMVPQNLLHEAQGWGLAARLCRRLSSCTTQGLSGSSLVREDGALVLRVQPALAALVNEGVERDLKALATHLGLRGEVQKQSAG
ncbi:exopolyphosphatase [Novosphingobium sp.]|uniref:Ppx/GppA phosphatase family protein n=1 Tax=Novosphingobium sp. TaxID=1874826 RepID=UPI0038BB72FF